MATKMVKTAILKESPMPYRAFLSLKRFNQDLYRFRKTRKDNDTTEPTHAIKKTWT